MGAEILLILLLIALNGALAMSEIALVSVKKTRLRERANRGEAGAAAALQLVEAPTRFLSTVQIGITLVGIFAGAFGGATVAEHLQERLEEISSLAPYAEVLALAVVVLTITYLSLVFGEIVPKRIALNNPESISTLVARPIGLLATLTRPAVAVLSASTEAVLFVLRLRPSQEAQVTEADIKLLLEQATQAGVFEAEEQEMAERALALGDRRVTDLMTPRPKISWLDIDESQEANWRKIAESPHTYLVVCEGDLDRLLGVVSAKELWSQHVSGQQLDLRNALVPPRYVPDQTPVFALLKQFSEPAARIAIVVNEHGAIEGIITPTDILEEIAGEVAGQLTQVAPPIQRDDGSWLLDGLTPLHELLELFDLEERPAEERREYQTLGGLVMRQLGRVPAAGDDFEWQGLHFEVMDMDGFRVDKVLVRGGWTPSESPSPG